MQSVFKFLATTALGLVLAAPAVAGDKAIIVMDASGSMWGQIDGKTKIEIARETLGSVIGTFPKDTELGLMAYGHREKGVCTDIEQLVQTGTDNRDAIIGAVSDLNPKGKTPLSDAVKQAAQSLKYTEDKATVILVTDGIETCDADPCALANSLEQQGVDFTAHVVGFGLSREEGQQVACLAENTGGKYIEAKDAGALSEALTQVAQAPEPTPEPVPASAENNVSFTAVLTEGGEPIEEHGRYDFFPIEGEKLAKKSVAGGYEDAFTETLEPGRYLLRYKINRVVAETIVDVKAGEKIDRDIILNAGVVDFKIALDESGEVYDGGSFTLEIGGTKDTTYNSMKLIAPAGSGKLLTKVGRSQVEHDVTLAAGERLSKTFVTPTGRFAATATYTEGGETLDDNISFKVVGAKKSLNGKRKNWDTSYTKADMMLPPGDYVVVVKAQEAIVEMPFSIEANGLTEIVVPMNAGIAAISAPGARSITVLESKANLSGKHKSLQKGYGEQMQIIMADGEYLVRVDYQEDKAIVDMPVKVTAGERTEITVE